MVETSYEQHTATLTCTVKLRAGKDVKIEELIKESDNVSIKWVDTDLGSICANSIDKIFSENFELSTTASSTCMLRPGVVYHCNATYLGYSNFSIINISLPIEG